LRADFAHPPCFLPLLFDYVDRQGNGANSFQLSRSRGIGLHELRGLRDELRGFR